MGFVDGENLVCRYQDMIRAGRNPNVSSISHIKDVYVWHPNMAINPQKMVRVNYYASAVGDDDRISTIREAVDQHLVAPDDYGRRVCPHVFKKPKASAKIKLLDISLTIDVLRNVYRDQLDIAYLFSGDADFVPLIQEVMRNGKLVIVAAFSSGLSPEMKRVGDQFLDLDQWFFLPSQ